MTSLIKLSVIGLLFVCISCTEPPTEPQKKIDVLFSNYNEKTPGVAVVIVKDQEIIHSKGYGMANLEYPIPISSKTVFHTASVSKQFTAFAIYLLEKQGKISLEDDVRDYIPELPDYGATIKVRHLLSHTSGLRDQWAILTLAGWRLDDVITTDQILKLASRQKELNFEPGSQLGYCNTSYTLLAEIIQRTTGKTLTEYAEEYMFRPLGMKDTQFYDDYHKVIENRAYSYEMMDNVYVKKKLNFSSVGATSLFTTAEDLVKWSNNFDNPIVGDKELMQAFNEGSLLDTGEPAILNIIGEDTLFHAKGQLRRHYRGVDILKHGGHDAGFRAFLARFPDEKFTIITLSNDEHYEIFARGLEIAEFYLAEKLEPKYLPPAASTAQNNRDESIATYTLALDAFEGSYRSDELQTGYQLKVQDSKLIMTHKRLDDIVLRRTGNHTFNGAISFSISLEFSLQNGKVTGFEVSNFGAKKVKFGAE